MGNNYNIKRNAPEPSQEDIQKFMDFDALLEAHRNAETPQEGAVVRMFTSPREGQIGSRMRRWIVMGQDWQRQQPWLCFSSFVPSMTCRRLHNLLRLPMRILLNNLMSTLPWQVLNQKAVPSKSTLPKEPPRIWMQEPAW